MSAPHHDPGQGAGIRQEAAAWVARMQRPDAARHRAALERWLAADPAHLATYNRVTARFADAKILRTSRKWGRTPAPAMPIARAPRVAAVAALAGLLVLSVTGLTLWRGGTALPPAVHAPAGSAQPVQVALTTRRGEIRTITLADGSRVTLDTGSALVVHFSDAVRGMRLLRGRARFEVAHAARPFVVSAGGRQVTARGTVFDVEIGAGDRIRVALVRGVIDVARVPATGRGPGMVQRLVAGEQLVLATRLDGQVPMPLSSSELAWPEGMTDIEDLPLADLLSRANRYADRPLVLADADLATIQVSGRFRINAPRRLADNLARLLDLEVRDAPDRILLVRPK